MRNDGPFYDTMFRRLEGQRWELGDLPFGDVDRIRVDEETLVFLRVNCLMELSSLYATRMFLRDFRDQPDFCQFISIWYYEEMKHYLVLREYLKCFGMEPDVTEYPELDTELSPSPWAPTLAIHYCGELRLGMWYHRWSQMEKEPVLSKIFELIGNDEFRHAGCYKEFMERAIEREPHRLVEFIQAAKWMLVNPLGDKHPTTMKSDRETESSVVDRIDGYEVMQARIQRTINDEDETSLRKKVLATFSRLSGQNLETLSGMAALARDLADAEPGREPAGQAASTVR